jgi:hypothetical protein
MARNTVEINRNAKEKENGRESIICTWIDLHMSITL